jgi:hypothetical protein
VAREILLANKACLKGDEATLREQSRAHLQNQKLAGQRDAFVQSIRSQANKESPARWDG